MFGASAGNGGSSTAIEILYDPVLSSAFSNFEARVSGLAGLMPRQY